VQSPEIGGHRAAPYKGWSLFAASGNAVKVWDGVGKRSGRNGVPQCGG